MITAYHVRQRQGYIPNQPKPNQDAFVCVKNLAGVEGLWLLGVCDGHGANGHLISDFVKKTLPRTTSKLIHEAIGHPFRETSSNFMMKVTSGVQKKSGGNSSSGGGGNKSHMLPPLVKMQKPNKSSNLPTDVIEFETKGEALMRMSIEEITTPKDA